MNRFLLTFVFPMFVGIRHFAGNLSMFACLALGFLLEVPTVLRVMLFPCHIKSGCLMVTIHVVDDKLMIDP